MQREMLFCKYLEYIKEKRECTVCEYQCVCVCVCVCVCMRGCACMWTHPGGL